MFTYETGIATDGISKKNHFRNEILNKYCTVRVMDPTISDKRITINSGSDLNYNTKFVILSDESKKNFRIYDNADDHHKGIKPSIRKKYNTINELKIRDNDFYEKVKITKNTTFLAIKGKESNRNYIAFNIDTDNVEIIKKSDDEFRKEIIKILDTRNHKI